MYSSDHKKAKVSYSTSTVPLEYHKATSRVRVEYNQCGMVGRVQWLWSYCAIVSAGGAIA